MDWYFDGRSPEAVRDLRHEIARYLGRHAAPGSSLDDAELVVSEVLTNVVRHASGPAWVSLTWRGPNPMLVVNDLGPGFELNTIPEHDLASASGRGLSIVSHITERLAVAHKRAGGARVEVELPVERAPDSSRTPLRHTIDALPTVEEAAQDGSFGKEAFLRALVVELSRAVELQEGPDAAEQLVTHVGMSVGGQMEEAYRRARGITERLSPEQTADLYIRLKAAIDGDFYVIEATDERIVLGNRACPFGEVVKRSPALCRMTSSVFGGIAARNNGSSTVQLEERIAVGDPECRVVVWLGEREPERYGHRYSHLP